VYKVYEWKPGLNWPIAVVHTDILYPKGPPSTQQAQTSGRFERRLGLASAKWGVDPLLKYKTEQTSPLAGVTTQAFLAVRDDNFTIV
jgi:hypothetical protein